MKPFNLEEAIAGAPMITRDGRKVVFIAYDEDAYQPVVCKVFNPNGGAFIETFDSDGCFYGDSDTSGGDLLMVAEKKTVWINFYQGDNGSIYTFTYPSELIADQSADAVNRIGGKAYPVEIDV